MRVFYAFVLHGLAFVRYPLLMCWLFEEKIVTTYLLRASPGPDNLMVCAWRAMSIASPCVVPLLPADMGRQRDGWRANGPLHLPLHTPMTYIDQSRLTAAGSKPEPGRNRSPFFHVFGSICKC